MTTMPSTNTAPARVTIAQVEQAFQRLIRVLRIEDCSEDYIRAVDCARVDVLAILNGEWVPEETDPNWA